MSPEAQARLVAQLGREEGYRRSAYQDSLGFWTIGFGRLIDPRKGAGLSLVEATYLLTNDVAERQVSLAPFAWYSSQDDVRQVALLDMAFNLGVEGLLHFPKFLMHMGAKEYPESVAELVGTPWHRETGPRAVRIEHMIETGQWPGALL